VPANQAKAESLMISVQPSTDEESAPKVELKLLPPSLRYEFLCPSFTYPVIVNASLSACQIDSLLRILRLHHKATRYTLDDLKGTLLCACIAF